MKRISLIVITLFILIAIGLIISTFESDAADEENPKLSGASVAMIVQRISLGDEPQTIMLKKIDKVTFDVAGESHTAQIRRIYSDYLTMNINSFEGIEVNLYPDKTEKVDVNNDSVYDLAMTLHEIVTINIVNITFEKIAEDITAAPEEVIFVEEPIEVPEDVVEEMPKPTIIPEPIIEEPLAKSKAWMWIVGIIAAAIIIGIVFWQKKKK